MSYYFEHSNHLFPKIFLKECKESRIRGVKCSLLLYWTNGDVQFKKLKCYGIQKGCIYLNSISYKV